MYLILYSVSFSITIEQVLFRARKKAPNLHCGRHETQNLKSLATTHSKILHIKYETMETKFTI